MLPAVRGSCCNVQFVPRALATLGRLTRPASFCQQLTSPHPYGSCGLGRGRSLAPCCQPSGHETEGYLRGDLPSARLVLQSRIAGAGFTTGRCAANSESDTVPFMLFTSEVPCGLSRHATSRHHPASPKPFGSCGIGPSKTLTFDGWPPDHVLDKPLDWALHFVRPAPKSRIGGAGPTAGLMPCVPSERCLPAPFFKAWLASAGVPCTPLPSLLRAASPAPKSRIGGSGPTACVASRNLPKIESHGSRACLCLWSLLMMNLPVSITAMPTPEIPHATAREASELTELSGQMRCLRLPQLPPRPLVYRSWHPTTSRYTCRSQSGQITQRVTSWCWLPWRQAKATISHSTRLRPHCRSPLMATQRLWRRRLAWH